MVARDLGLVAGSEDPGPVGDVVGQPGGAEQPLAVDGRAAEGVDPLGEELFELLERELVKGRLAALGEQLGQAVVLQGALGGDLHELASRWVVEADGPPGLAVQEHLEPGVAVGGVDLDLQLCVGERDGRGPCPGRRGREGGGESAQQQQDEQQVAAVSHLTLSLACRHPLRWRVLRRAS
jgi:hypothetical protein